MPKYMVTGTVTISVNVTVEAKSKEEARAKAREAPMMTLCNQCARGAEDEWSTSGELDGAVTIRRDGITDLSDDEIEGMA